MDKREWIEAWGADALIHLVSQSRSLISDTDSDFLREYGLPRRVILDEESGVEVSFDAIQWQLKELSAIEFSNVELEFLERLNGYAIIGAFDFCNGDAFCCIRIATGDVIQFDIESDEPEWFTNSSVRQYGLSLLLATQWSAASRSMSSDNWIDSLATLREALVHVDAPAFDQQGFYWPALLDHIADCEPGSFTITTDLKMSRSRF